MDKILEGVARSLKVRRTIDRTQNCLESPGAFKYEYEDVPDTVAKQFKVELINHVNGILNYKDDVVYSFNNVKGFMQYCRERMPYKGIRNNVNSLDPVQNRLFRDANNNLAEVFNKLPSLGEGEEYAFPRETFVIFTLIERRGKVKKVKVFASHWVIQKN